MWKADGIRRRRAAKCLYSWPVSAVSLSATAIPASSTSQNIRWVFGHARWSRWRMSTRRLRAAPVLDSEAAWTRRPITTRPSSSLDAAWKTTTVGRSTGPSPSTWRTGGGGPNAAPVYSTIPRPTVLFRPTPFVDSANARSGFWMISATVRGIRMPTLVLLKTLWVSVVGQIAPFSFMRWIASRCTGRRFFEVCLEANLVLRFYPMQQLETQGICPSQSLILM